MKRIIIYTFLTITCQNAFCCTVRDSETNELLRSKPGDILVAGNTLKVVKNIQKSPNFLYDPTYFWNFVSAEASPIKNNKLFMDTDSSLCTYILKNQRENTLFNVNNYLLQDHQHNTEMKNPKNQKIMPRGINKDLPLISFYEIKTIYPFKDVKEEVKKYFEENKDQLFENDVQINFIDYKSNISEFYENEDAIISKILDLLINKPKRWEKLYREACNKVINNTNEFKEDYHQELIKDILCKDIKFIRSDSLIPDDVYVVSFEIAKELARIAKIPNYNYVQQALNDRDEFIKQYGPQNKLYAKFAQELIQKEKAQQQQQQIQQQFYDKADRKQQFYKFINEKAPTNKLYAKFAQELKEKEQQHQFDDNAAEQQQQKQKFDKKENIDDEESDVDEKNWEEQFGKPGAIDYSMQQSQFPVNKQSQQQHMKQQFDEEEEQQQQKQQFDKKENIDAEESDIDKNWEEQFGKPGAIDYWEEQFGKLGAIDYSMQQSQQQQIQQQFDDNAAKQQPQELVNQNNAEEEEEEQNNYQGQSLKDSITGAFKYVPGLNIFRNLFSNKNKKQDD